jgi:3-deoxy-manno-octulosonate cytidylyltransferase (CMP-KDO synthetase)
VKIVVCIPARFASTRFPAKVLAKDTGKYLVQHVWEKACRAKLPHKVIIATDDSRVVDAAKSFGAEAVLTSRDCASGTDRIAEAVKKLSPIPYPLNPDDIVINLQGDEPEIESEYIDVLASLLVDNPDYPMGTLAAPFQNADQIADPAIVKVIVAYSVERRADRDSLNAKRYPLSAALGSAIYFSRSVIPYDRSAGGIGPIKNYLRHLGIYAYRKDFLLKITTLPQSMLEKTESLEQLRVIENGFTILVGVVEKASDGIDTPDQYAEFVKRYKKAKN